MSVVEGMCFKFWEDGAGAAVEPTGDRQVCGTAANEREV